MFILPELSPASKANIGIAAGLAAEYMREADLNRKRAALATLGLQALEHSVCINGERFDLERQSEQHSEKAIECAYVGAAELFEAYAEEYWRLLSRDPEKLSCALSVVGQQVEQEIACPELSNPIRKAIGAKKIEWLRRTRTAMVQGRPHAEMPRPSFASDECRTDVACKPPMAQNTDDLRRECGWSVDELSKATGLDKKLVSGHLHGKGAYPRTLKTYADAFTEKLGRTVSVTDLRLPRR